MEKQTIDRNQLIVNMVSKLQQVGGSDDQVVIAHNNALIFAIQTVMKMPIDGEDDEFNIVKQGLSGSGLLSNIQIFELLNHSKNSEKLMAIKKYKDLTGIGLKDAKEEFDKIFAKLGI